MATELKRILKKQSFWVLFFILLLASNLLLIIGTDWYQPRQVGFSSAGIVVFANPPPNLPPVADVS